MAVNLNAYLDKFGKRKLAVIETDTEEEHHVTADSTDMSRLWGKARKMQGDASKLDFSK